MIAVVQRVTEASVRVAGETVGAIATGLLVLVAVCDDDTPADVEWMARKLASLRLFRNGNEHFDVDVRQAGGSVLLVSNFTVAAATRQGRRPSFDSAAGAEKGRALFDALVASVGASGIPVQTGRFGADMQVSLVNDGPVTVIVNSAEARAPARPG